MPRKDEPFVRVDSDLESDRKRIGAQCFILKVKGIEEFGREKKSFPFEGKEGLRMRLGLVECQ